MGIQLTAAARYDNVPTGIYQAKLVEITEPKEYKSTYNGQERIQMKSRFVYEITFAQDADIVGERISNFVNMGARGPKSGLFKELKGLGVNPMDDFDSDDLIGRSVQLVVQVEQDNNGVWRSNITGMNPTATKTPPAKQAAAPATRNPF